MGCGKLVVEDDMEIFSEPARFVRALPDRGSLLAIDVSKRRLGLAGTDLERRLVTPLVTLWRGRWEVDVERLRLVLRRREAVGMVVGWPINMDGSEGVQAERARAFATGLGQVFALPVLLQDERLTTFAVEEAIREGRLPKPKRRSAPLDHYAAAIILEDALRAMAGAKAHSGALCDPA